MLILTLGAVLLWRCFKHAWAAQEGLKACAQGLHPPFEMNTLNTKLIYYQNYCQLQVNLSWRLCSKQPVQT